ncbi:hypothetical protein D9758_017712 [Tetrapyrgos nigripes]|uniref:Uncharacterized protein n=1 Tax=Tetrapyrgos nigripes TaxID=182062 RepID=A0A8H5C8B2_9AGAR|nr:hypothetical protein D9758_017712 [Tetrapyrgos nigripes]
MRKLSESLISPEASVENSTPPPHTPSPQKPPATPKHNRTGFPVSSPRTPSPNKPTKSSPLVENEVDGLLSYKTSEDHCRVSAGLRLLRPPCLTVSIPITIYSGIASTDGEEDATEPESDDFCDEESVHDDEEYDSAAGATDEAKEDGSAAEDNDGIDEGAEQDEDEDLDDNLDSASTGSTPAITINNDYAKKEVDNKATNIEGANKSHTVEEVKHTRKSPEDRSLADAIRWYGDGHHSFTYDPPRALCEVMKDSFKIPGLDTAGLYDNYDPLRVSLMLSFNLQPVDASSLKWENVKDVLYKDRVLSLVVDFLKFDSWRSFCNPARCHVLSFDWGSQRLPSGINIEFLQAARFKSLNDNRGPLRIMLSVGSSRLAQFEYTASVIGNTLEETSYIGPTVYRDVEWEGKSGPVGGVQYSTCIGPFKGNNVQRPPTAEQLKKFDEAYSTNGPGKSSSSRKSSNTYKAQATSPYTFKDPQELQIQHTSAFPKPPSTSMKLALPIFDLALKPGRRAFKLPDDLQNINAWPLWPASEPHRDAIVVVTYMVTRYRNQKNPSSWSVTFNLLWVGVLAGN